MDQNFSGATSGNGGAQRRDVIGIQALPDVVLQSEAALQRIRSRTRLSLPKGVSRKPK